MKVILPVLYKTDSWQEHLDKLREEKVELENEIMEYSIYHKNNKMEVAEETLDTIQVCIGILDKLSQEGLEMGQVFMKHQKKLINRGWRIKNIIDIEV